MPKLYVSKIIDSLKHLADEQFQRKAWLSTGAYPVSSFSEDICQLFDDTGLSDLLEKGLAERYLGLGVTAQILKLDSAIDQVDDSLSPQEILELPEMEEVRKQAAVVLDAMAKANLS